MNADVGAGADRTAGGNYLRNTIVVIVGILSTTLPQTNVLVRIPVLNLLKNELHVDKTAAASFIFLTGLAWYAKPLIGIINDAFPMFGSRRKSYLILGGALATAAMALAVFLPHQYGLLVGIMILANIGFVIGSCSTGGLLVETAQTYNVSGRLAGIRQSVQAVSFVISGLVSGYLASLAFGVTAGLCAVLAFLIVPTALLVLREPYHPPQPLSAIKVQFRNLINAKTMWAAAGLTLLFYIAPGVSTVLFYRQQNVLHMSTEIQGLLTSTQYATSIATAIAYSFFSRRLTLRSLLTIGIFGAAITGAFYLFYNSLALAFLIDGLNGVGYTLAELAFLDLIARSTPAGSESLGYSLMLSVRNLALFGTDVIGAKLTDSFGVSFNSLVLINASTTMIALPFVFLLPAALMARKDSDPVLPETGSIDEAMPRPAVQTHT